MTLRYRSGQAMANVTANVSGADSQREPVQFGNQLSVQAPTFASNQVMVSLTLMQQNGLLMLTDFKTPDLGQSMNLHRQELRPRRCLF